MNTPIRRTLLPPTVAPRISTSCVIRVESVEVVCVRPVFVRPTIRVVERLRTLWDALGSLVWRGPPMTEVYCGY